MFNLILVLIIAIVFISFIFIAIEVHDAPLMSDDEMTVISQPKHHHKHHKAA